ncbi:MAG: acyl-CoA/acyl-ACP dehydrogenase, partial [Leptospiraceae bacterium]|nr:acyl-CoA/acyl-ACP dehydrogenase [Leptospiraceae bacterium]
MKAESAKLNEQLESTLKRVTEHLARQAEDGGRISVSKMDENQYVHYNLAYHTAESRISSQFTDYAHDQGKGTGELEQNMAYIFAGEALNRLRGELAGRMDEYGISSDDLNALFSTENNKIIQDATKYTRYNSVSDQVMDGQHGANALGEDHAMLRDTFRQFADEVVAPQAEHVHRHDDFIPDDILNGLAEMGAFGLSIPGQYGGYMDDYGNVGMMVVTEELSRGGLSIAGSLITRPEILSKAIIKGGTEEQKQKWLPKLAAGEIFNAVAVTEPNYGSDVAGMKVAAEKTDGGWLLNGVKTWCTFAGYADAMMVLARTESDPDLKHKGLSILIAEKPRDKGHRFEHTQDGGGKVEGSAIATIGYRGMHSFEVNFDNYFVPDENLVGGEAGRGQGFYLQMAGFAGGRVQTAARANGVMQASLEAAVRYASERKVFGQEIGNYQLTKWKIARMAMIVQASRQYAFHVARLMDDHKGAMEATLVKFYASRISEWVAREAMQIHGGMGYAEEYAVSRYFVDARVFSIFEGAEEVMALRVCAR